MDASAATIDVLPSIVRSVATRIPVLMDGGVRSGLDVAKGLALGAAAVFAGRAFMTGVAALGKAGGLYVADLLAEELEVAMTQLGCSNLLELQMVEIRHDAAWPGRADA